MKKNKSTRIDYSLSDCKVRQLGEVVTISYYGEVVCVISEVKDYIETLSLITCMFAKKIMFAKISSYQLKKLFINTAKPRLVEVVKEVVETVNTVKVENVIERSVFIVKEVVYFFRKKKVALDNIITPRLKNPIPNLKFNLH